VEDLPVSRSQVGGGGQRFAGAGVAGQARVGAAADLEAVSGDLEAASGREHVRDGG